MNRKCFIMDIETIKSIWTYTGFNIDTKETVSFILHKDKFQFNELYKHLIDCRFQIGFNNINFDYPVIHHFLINYKRYIEQNRSSEYIISDLYNKAQDIINNQNNNPFGSQIREKEVIIPQLDLFKVWHYDNRAKATSLKALEISMNYSNVMDMPISHENNNITLEQIPEILEYNLNDVMATYEFYKKTVQFGKIDLRKDIKKKYGLECTNWNNGKIGENLILKLYCDKTGRNIWDVKKLRSERLKIALKDCIPQGISFKTKEFNYILDKFREKVINVEDSKSTSIKAKEKNKVGTIIYKECLIDYGLGGVHGVCKTGVYESNEYFIIKSLDVASLYPWLPIVYNFWIEHLGPEFLDVYKDNIVNVRLQEKLKPKELQSKAIVDGFKEAANIPYGKSNDKYSALYDPLYTFKTTISGQLVTSILCERLGEIPEMSLLMYNTDGMEVKIPRKYEELYDKICKEWETETKLTLEFADYQKMWIGDINNYGCITTKGKIKNKGRFEVDKVIGNEPAYYKDNSFRIVPLAIQKYFTDNILTEDTIRNHKDIYDFCGRQKFKGKDYGIIKYISVEKTALGSFNCINEEKQQKNVRYYISNKGASFIKKYAKGTIEVINKGYSVTIFNKYIEKPVEKYNINYLFYIEQANKEINEIISKQLNLL